jgi:hypothetical protein
MKLIDYLEKYYPSKQKGRKFNVKKFAEDNGMAAQSAHAYIENPKSVITDINGELSITGSYRSLLVNKLPAVEAS